MISKWLFTLSYDYPFDDNVVEFDLVFKKKINVLANHIAAWDSLWNLIGCSD